MLKVEIILNNTWSIMLKKKCNIVCFSMIWISDMKERERMTFLIYSKGMKKKKKENYVTVIKKKDFKNI